MLWLGGGLIFGISSLGLGVSILPGFWAIGLYLCPFCPYRIGFLGLTLGLSSGFVSYDAVLSS